MVLTSSRNIMRVLLLAAFLVAESLALTSSRNHIRYATSAFLKQQYQPQALPVEKNLSALQLVPSSFNRNASSSSSIVKIGRFPLTSAWHRVHAFLGQRVPHFLSRLSLQQKRRALAFCLVVFAWGRTGSSKVAHAVPSIASQSTTSPAAPFEQAQKPRGGGILTSRKDKKDKSMNAKMATAIAGTVVLAPSIGLIIGKKVSETGNKDAKKLESKKTASTVLQAAKTNQTQFTNTTNTPTNSTTKQFETSADLDAKIKAKVNESREKEKKEILDKVLRKANEARQKVDSKTYMKSLQKEKAAVHDALESFKKQASTQTKPPPTPSSSSSSSTAPTNPKEASKTPPPAEAPISRTTTTKTIKSSTITAETKSELPLMSKKYIQARSQPKSWLEEQRLQRKYGNISDVGERAYQIIVDLGMVERNNNNIDDNYNNNNESSTSTELPNENDEPFQ